MKRRSLLLATATSPLAIRGVGVQPKPDVPAEKGMRTCTLRQGEIAYLDEGCGPPALFIHGWPLSGHHWRPMIDAVKSVRRCLAPDLMGLGWTRVAADQSLSPVAQTDMLIDFLDALALATVDVVANDSGTCIAQLLAVAAPHRVRSLLLTNGDVDTNSPPAALAPALAAARAGVLDQLIEQHLVDTAFAHSEAGLGGLCYTDPRNLTLDKMLVYFKPLLSSPLRRYQFQRYGQQFEPTPLIAIRSSLQALQIPARMVWGTGDIHFSIEWAYWLDHCLSRSTGVREVAGAKLFFTEEFPALMAEEASRLWSLT